MRKWLVLPLWIVMNQWAHLQVHQGQRITWAWTWLAQRSLGRGGVDGALFVQNSWPIAIRFLMKTWPPAWVEEKASLIDPLCVSYITNEQAQAPPTKEKKKEENNGLPLTSLLVLQFLFFLITMIWWYFDWGEMFKVLSLSLSLEIEDFV